MKNFSRAPLLLLLALLLTLPFAGCRTAEQRAQARLRRDSESMQGILKNFPNLADYTTRIVRDSLPLTPQLGRVRMDLARDTGRWNRQLRAFVATEERLKYLQTHAHAEAAPLLPDVLQGLVKRRATLRDSLQLGAFRGDSVYTYHDEVLDIQAKFHNGQLDISYVTKLRWVPYDKQISQLQLHDCPPDKFWAHREFWFINAGWLVLFLSCFGLLRLTRRS